MSIAIFIISFVVAGILSFCFVPFVRRLAFHLHVFDEPSRAPLRKAHEAATPLLGGIAVFCSFFFLAFIVLALLDVDPSASAIKMKHLVGLAVGGALLMIGGFLDDRFSLPPRRQIIWPILAAFVVIASGIGITYITHPFGGPLGTEQIRLDRYETILFWFAGWPYKLTLFADLFTFLWLMGMMYTTKFLDGLDGLVSGVTIIGAFGIAALALNPFMHQSAIALLALMLAGSFVGFLIWNWHPARIFLGEGGSLFAGFMLGALSILSGSKVATTVLVLAVPVLDGAWVILYRLFWKRHSPFVGDRQHLHFRLLSWGFSHRVAVLFLYAISLLLGLVALLWQSI